jgi:glycosyltransferase involved in cell wall biosynthesis
MIIETIVLTLNDAANLGPAVRSALDPEDVEPSSIIVVDDGSAEHLVKTPLALNESRVRVIHCEERGEMAARNAGLRSPSAPVIAFLHADDASILTISLERRTPFQPRLIQRYTQRPHMGSIPQATFVRVPARTDRRILRQEVPRQEPDRDLRGRDERSSFSARFATSAAAKDLALWLCLFRERFEILSGTHPIADYTVSSPRCPGRVRGNDEWVFYRELLSSRSLSHTERFLIIRAIFVRHIRDRVGQW